MKKYFMIWTTDGARDAVRPYLYSVKWTADRHAIITIETIH